MRPESQAAEVTLHHAERSASKRTTPDSVDGQELAVANAQPFGA